MDFIVRVIAPCIRVFIKWFLNWWMKLRAVFKTDAFHAGMDEVFYIGHDSVPDALA